MKIKSKYIDYHQLYSILLISVILFILYIGINYFLPVANFISLFILTFSIFFLLVYFFSKNLNHLIISLTGGILSTILCLAYSFLS